MKQKENKSEKIVLSVQKRIVLGKKNKSIRKQGLIPSNIFGTNFTSQAIAVPIKEFSKTYKIAGATGIVHLLYEKQEVPTLIRSIQRDPLENHILHVDFRKIDLDKKIEAEVPIKIIGTSITVNQTAGVLITQTEKLLVEALPQNIPHHIEIDISVLKEIGNQIMVKDIPQNALYVIKTETDRVIVSVTAHKEESIVAETAAAVAPEVITAKPEEATETTVTQSPAPAGTDKKPEEKK